MHGVATDGINYPVLLLQTYQEALERNEGECKHWQKLKEEYSSLQNLLKELPNELSKDVMVPVAPRALMRGKIVHTNEILVCLGQGYFVKRSGAQAAAICMRREKLCNDMLQSLEKERELFVGRQEVPLQQEAFGGGREIIEVYSEEEEEAHWRVEHKQKEREYRQKLAELRTKEKTAVTDEESLWQRLDELELQEELEEELDRLHADDDDDEEVEEEEEEDDKEMNETSLKTGEDPENGETQTTSLTPSSRRVSFAGMEEDIESGEEDLRITFQHSKQLPIHIKTEVKSIESPAELYEHFRNQFLEQPRSILKKTSSYDNNMGIAIRSESANTAEIEADEEYSSPIFQPPPVLEEVVERNVAMNNQLPTLHRPVSRFKALRQQKKR